MVVVFDIQEVPKQLFTTHVFVDDVGVEVGVVPVMQFPPEQTVPS